MGSYIAWGLAALVALVLFAPVAVEAVWRKEVLFLKLRLLGFLPITLLPAKEKPDKPPKAKKEKKPKKKPEEQPPKAKKKAAATVLDTLQLINDLLPHLAQSLGHLLKGITLSRCNIALIVGEEEASDTALAFGKANAVGYSAYAVLCGFIRVKEFRFHVFPDYLSCRQMADVEVTVKLRPATFLAGGLVLAFHALGVLLRRPKPPDAPAPGADHPSHPEKASTKL